MNEFKNYGDFRAENRRDAIEAFGHMFVGDYTLVKRLMKMVDDYSRMSYLRESKLLIERLENAGVFKEGLSLRFDEKQGEICMYSSSKNVN